LTPGRPAFRPVLVQVDRNVTTVDQDKGDGRPSGLPERLRLAYRFYGIMTVTAGSNKKSKKLSRVISTKLSIEDYERFQKCTNFAYKAGYIEEPSTSNFLRFIVTYPFKEMGL
jgi:hypothetical protein